jgi:hypothetical protein
MQVLLNRIDGFQPFDEHPDSIHLGFLGCFRKVALIPPPDSVLVEQSASQLVKICNVLIVTPSNQMA